MIQTVKLETKHYNMSNSYFDKSMHKPYRNPLELHRKTQGSPVTGGSWANKF